MSLLANTERGRRSSLAVLVALVGGAVIALVGVAALAVGLVGDPEQPAATPRPTDGTDPPMPVTSGGVPGSAVRLVEAGATTAGVGTGWPDSIQGAVSAAADYTTLSTIDLGLLRQRLNLAYSDRPSSAGEVAQIVRDTRRGRANLGVPLGEPATRAQVQIEPLAVSYLSDPGEVEGYVLVRRELVAESGNRMPPDVLPVPFVVRRLDGDWRLTAETVSWSPPPVGTVGDPARGEWRALLPPG